MKMMERELLISNLKSKIGKYNQKGTELQEENARLNNELEMQKLNLQHINDYLTRELEAKENKAGELEGKAADLEGRLASLTGEHEAQMDALREQKSGEIKKLQASIEEYEMQFKDLSEFQEKKASMEGSLKDLKATLERERKEHEEKISDLERKAVQEKDRLKKETALKIKETKANMMKLTDNQLETTTKRTILENEQMTSELSYQSRQTEKLLQRNDELLSENAEVRRKLELSKELEAEIAKRNNIYQKTIKTLVAKLRGAEAVRREQGEELVQVGETMEELENRLTEQGLVLEEVQASREQLQDETLRTGENLRVLEDAQDEASTFLLQCLSDIKDQIVATVRENTEGDGVVPEGEMPGHLKQLNLKQREFVLNQLFQRLESARGGSMPASEFVLPSISSPGKLEALYGMQRQKSLESFASSVSLASEFIWPAQQHSALSEEREMVAKSTQTLDVNVPDRDELQRRLKSDVRPWGKKSSSIPLSHRGTSTYIRKGQTHTNMTKATKDMFTPPAYKGAK